MTQAIESHGERTTREATARPVTYGVAVAILHYVQRARGRAVAEDLLRLAGIDRPLEDQLTAVWAPRAETLALAQVARVLCGDAEIGRRAGEEMMRLHVGDGIGAFLRAAGAPGPALEKLLSYGSRAAVGVSYDVTRCDNRGITVEVSYGSGGVADSLFCGVHAGYWSMVPSLFGSVGVAVEPTCRCRGDEFCAIEVSWERGASITGGESAQADEAVDRHLSYFENLQTVGEELTRASDVSDLMARILAALGKIMMVPRAVVAVRFDDGASPVVASRGLRPAVADVVGRLLLEGEYDGRHGTAVVAPLGQLGLIAALVPRDSESEIDQRQLQAFARHATATLDAVVARDQAERSRATATALLQLARALADVTSETELAARLVDRVPALVGCDHATLTRWDADRRALVPTVANPSGQSSDSAWTRIQIPGLDDFVARPKAFILTPDGTAPIVAKAMNQSGARRVAIVPVLSQGRLLALLSATYRGELPLQREELLARLQGAADLAATAIDRAVLVDQARHQALHDPLTGLANRALFADRVKHALSRRSYDGSYGQVAVILLDVDDFKDVNDNLGHGAGDQLLQHIAARIRSCIRDSDTAARLGGDEFAVLVEDGADETTTQEICERVLQNMTLDAPGWAGRTAIRASVGVAWAQPGMTGAELLRSADVAMYVAKGRGKHQTVVFEKGMTLTGNQHFAHKAELAAAVEMGDQFRLQYQPIMDLLDGTPVGFEALIRWRQDDGRLAPPASFIPAAEQTGLIHAIGHWALAEACTQVAEWNQTQPRPFTISVNISTRQLETGGHLSADVHEALSYSGLDPRLLILEITESAVIKDLDAATTKLAELKQLGVQIAIDDFGTGYSSLAHLQTLPVDILKIDRCFIEALTAKNHRLARLAEIVVTIGNAIGLQTVAEGVQTDQQATKLRQLGCPHAQGFLFAHPMDADTVPAWLTSLNLGPTLPRPSQS